LHIKKAVIYLPHQNNQLKNKIMSREEKEFRNDAKNFCVFIGMIALSAFIVINFILVR
jgi:hypothetical protein